MIGKIVPKIAYAQITNDYWSEQALKNIREAKPFVDFTILVHDGIRKEIKEQLEQEGTILVNKPFENNFPKFRNYYIDEARKHGAEYLLMSDTDEHFDNLFLSSIKSIILSCPLINNFEVYAHYHIEDARLMDPNEIAREAPAGIEDKTSWWKQMLVKLEPEMHFVGAVEGGTYHEHLHAEDWRTLKLPTKYFFTQVKTAQQIWRNSARAVVINGGGLDVRDKNPMYKELIPILDELNLREWSRFEEYCTNGNIDQRIKDIFIKYRTASQYHWDSENRSLFKWYFNSLHPKENTQNLQAEFIAENYTLPASVEDGVRYKYFILLGRDADKSGLEFYANEILTNKLTVLALDKVFMDSDEYLTNAVNTTFFEVSGILPSLTELNVWKTILKARNRMDLQFKDVIGNAAYSVQNAITKIVYCQMTHVADVDLTIANVKDVRPFVDDCIVVYDDTLNEVQRKQLRDAGAKAYYFKWHNNFPEMRNNYLTVARALSAGWVMVSDPDEHFDIRLLKNIKNSLLPAMAQGIDLLQVNSHDVYTDDENGKVLATPNEVVSNYWKNLIFQLKPTVGYIGVGETKNLHESMVGISKGVNLDKQFFYRHTKSHITIWEHSVRNIFFAGGGMNLGMKIPAYRKLRPILDNLNFKHADEFIDYLKGGNIYTELKQFIIENRNNYGHDYDSEYREFFKYYFDILHPEENVDHLKIDITDEQMKVRLYDDEAERNVAEKYIQVLKRYPDEDGLQYYTEQLRSGKMDANKLEEILKDSPEFKNLGNLPRQLQRIGR